MVTDLNRMGIQNISEEIHNIRIGRRIVVIPAQMKSSSGKSDIQIRMNPLKAFGDGKHPTTQLCLKVIERHIKPDDSFFDLGTGTGILAIAAAKLGANPIMAIDIDPESVKTAQMNIAANKLNNQIKVECGSLESLPKSSNRFNQFSFVAANISAKVLLSLFENDLIEKIKSGGGCILSGFLRMQSPAIRARLEWYDLDLVAEERLDG